MNSEHDNALPCFDSPPVVETVLSAQFERLAAFQIVHLGLFWQRVRNRFPRTQSHPELAAAFERQESTFQPPQIKFETVESLTPNRLWLLDESGSEMIQVQSDRFIKNWRKAAVSGTYPRYEHVIRPAFNSDFAEFKAFVAEENLGAVQVNQCEVTYVNHIVAGEGWERWDQVESVFSFWPTNGQDAFPGRTEDLACHLRFPVTGDDGAWLGRLHVDIHPAYRGTDGCPMYVMTLTARGRSGGDVEFFDVGRQWIVRAFASLTTPKMHEIWRRSQ